MKSFRCDNAIVREITPACTCSEALRLVLAFCKCSTGPIVAAGIKQHLENVQSCKDLNTCHGTDLAQAVLFVSCFVP